MKLTEEIKLKKLRATVLCENCVFFNTGAIAEHG